MHIYIHVVSIFICVLLFSLSYLPAERSEAASYACSALHCAKSPACGAPLGL
ncbi:hypothetical protein PF005_g23319 [Phytophthora fragariae]|uniref:RxLR effector protein n=1 Tax=Phytophthora fragariae TaxID=53985 RepID=A0A6A3S1S2_9STRA|nr:hypothetical protein PF003_g33314 [Phytophthora fragariae]KAE8925737.1 hypothetical protein PF009_g24056 [Phytophthora fragariae]KAE8980945.1 hypothetical protein PF011_g22223 [Phytophthora fragariae]KAE9079626.1 hypothetical protein PF010_g22685 [Phytophthora fragariae]KAE9107663.1 hypothetical protein PF007_g12952 [Phytophthora fragariae]